MKKVYFSQNEKLSTVEEILYNHSFDNDTGMIVRTGYSPALAVILGTIFFGVAALISL